MLDVLSRVDVQAWLLVVETVCAKTPGSTPVGLTDRRRQAWQTRWSVDASDEELLAALASFEFDRPPVAEPVAT